MGALADGARSVGRSMAKEMVSPIIEEMERLVKMTAQYRDSVFPEINQGIDDTLRRMAVKESTKKPVASSLSAESVKRAYERG